MAMTVRKPIIANKSTWFRSKRLKEHNYQNYYRYISDDIIQLDQMLFDYVTFKIIDQLLDIKLLNN